jgi:hypothetical protein
MAWKGQETITRQSRNSGQGMNNEGVPFPYATEDMGIASSCLWASHLRSSHDPPKYHAPRLAGLPARRALSATPKTNSARRSRVSKPSLTWNATLRFGRQGYITTFSPVYESTTHIRSRIVDFHLPQHKSRGALPFPEESFPLHGRWFLGRSRVLQTFRLKLWPGDASH